MPSARGCKPPYRMSSTPSLLSFNTLAWRSCAGFSEWPSSQFYSPWRPKATSSNKAAKWFSEASRLLDDRSPAEIPMLWFPRLIISPRGLKNVR
jgi:hypothetical protein